MSNDFDHKQGNSLIHGFLLWGHQNSMGELRRLSSSEMKGTSVMTGTFAPSHQATRFHPPKNRVPGRGEGPVLSLEEINVPVAVTTLRTFFLAAATRLRAQSITRGRQPQPSQNCPFLPF
jgi:hypothetical protein